MVRRILTPIVVSRHSLVRIATDFYVDGWDLVLGTNRIFCLHYIII
jgi:hypothetical protein